MRDVFVDVNLELDLDSLTGLDDPTAYIIETARLEADRLCDRNRSRLRTDRAPEILIEKGQHRETGQLCLLVATRWTATAPEDVVPTAPLGRYGGR